MGDYYLPHGAPFETTIPEYYTVVENDVVLPPITHTVIDELVLAPYTSLLTYVAFYLSGEEHEGLPGFGNPNLSPLSCPPNLEECPSGLCCLFENIACDTDPEQVPDYCYEELTFSCNPWTSGSWPECLDLDDDNDGPGPLTGGCSCAASYPTRHPAGCVRVEDTELPNNTLVDGQPMHMEGVNNVRVIWWDGWLGLKQTWTDANGCWHIDHREKGKAYMWVVFKNNDLRIRSGLGSTWNIAYLVAPIWDYIGQFGGGTYNNIEVNYTMWDQQGSKAHRRWGAANIMNALPDFRNRITNDGFNAPPSDLDIFLIMDGPTSNAAMLDHMSENPLNAIIDAGFFDIFGFSNNPPFGDLLESPVAEALFWDLIFNVNLNNSDDLYELLYHEFFHASHFDRVGSEYWSFLFIAEALAGGWGNENSLDAGRIALCESIAEHIGWTYTHDRYGVNNSLLGITWETRLEEIRNRILNHVPIGIYHDLKDGMNGMMNACDRLSSPPTPRCGPIVDNVSNFTDAQMLSLLQSNVETVDEYLTLLSTFITTTGNNQADYDDLLNSY